MSTRKIGTRLRPANGLVMLLLIVAMVVAVAPAGAEQAPAAGAEVVVEQFSTLPIDDTDNPCGSAVGSATGFGVVTTHTRDDGSTRVVTRFIGEFDVDLTGDPVPNVWDEEAVEAEGLLMLRTVEDSAKGFRLRLRVWGTTDTDVSMRINQKLVADPSGGYMAWNCFDGTGRHRVDL